MADSATKTTPTSGLQRWLQQADWRDFIVYIGFIVVFTIFSFLLSDRGFLSQNNILNIVRQSATISVMAVAMTLVLCSAEIDLSVGGVAGLASVTTAMVIQSFGVIPGIFAGILTGLTVGIINGTLVTRVGIPSFLVTLGMMGIARGTAMWITDTAPIPILEKNYTALFGSGNLFGAPSLLIWTLVMMLAGHFLLRYTPFGRQILATGGNEQAARYSGVNTMRIKFYTLVISGGVAALAGMLYAGRLQTGRFQWGEGDELSVIAAVVLGGTSLFGGKGTVIGAVMGSLLIGLINNGLILMGLEFSQQLIIRGVIIILAVALTGRRT